MNKQDAASKKNDDVKEDASKHEEAISEIKQEVENAGQEAASPEAVIADLNDKLLRTVAEMQNLRRRHDLDMKNAKDYSIVSFARDLLGVMDNLCRAAESISDEDAANDGKLKSIKDGVEITKKELANVFERNHIKRIGAVGEKFDHNLHQAMTQIEDKEKPAGTIIDVMMPGYVIKDRLLRPAMVVVTK